MSKHDFLLKIFNNLQHGYQADTARMSGFPRRSVISKKILVKFDWGIPLNGKRENKNYGSSFVFLNYSSSIHPSL